MTRPMNTGRPVEPQLLPLRPVAEPNVTDSLLESLVAEVAARRRARGLPPVPVVLDTASGRIPAAAAVPLREALAPLVAAACEAAATAAPRLREVTITTVDTVAALEIEVADSGPGSTPAALAAARPPVERLGGTIVCAGCPDGGLAVTVRLPHHRLVSRAA